MKKLLIIAVTWTPYSHARFTAIAKNIRDMELTVFFQNSEVFLFLQIQPSYAT
jgi:hypothetical protein